MLVVHVLLLIMALGQDKPLLAVEVPDVKSCFAQGQQFIELNTPHNADKPYTVSVTCIVRNIEERAV
jgi:hypothetical protein